ncbi:MAG TPA: hypothetical protein VLD85_00525, partial [Anaeromyxobacteraceae bacterium]|nr:hypothetical protein [Anaeromyxobacteraceae bacterium]
MSSFANDCPAAFAPPVPLEVLAERARLLEAGAGHERRLPAAASRAVDGLLARVARGRGALDVALAEGLAALAEGDRFLRLGYSCCADYARERLDVAARTAQAMVQLGRELRSRPLLRQAVRRGEVSPRKAQAVLPVAVGEAEQAWVERARDATVRALERAVREVVAGRGREREAAQPRGGLAGFGADVRAWLAALAGDAEPGGGGAGACAGQDAAGADVCAGLEVAGAGVCTGREGGAPAGEPVRPAPLPPPDEEPWDRVEFEIASHVRVKLDQAMDLAGRLLGATAPKFLRLEAMCQEYVAAHPVEAEETVADWMP